MLVFGTCTVVVGKLLFETESEGRKFEKPWWQVLAMFIGMASCLIVYWWKKYVSKESREDRAGLLDEILSDYGFSGKMMMRIIPPAMCDMVATGLMNIGLVFIPASIWQLLRGSMIVFSAIFSVVFLKKKLYAYNWFGVFVALCALVMVGVACVESSDEEAKDPSKQLWGIGLVVVAQIIQAAQIVIEEFLLSNIKAAPALIVGIEGFWGTVVTTVLILPIVMFIPEPYGEDTFDTLSMLSHSFTLIWVSFVYIIVILGYNLFGMMVTQQYSAVIRTIMEALRTLFIWMTDLFIYYAVDKHHGEKLSAWSVLELFGFATLIFGTVVYRKILILPGFYYPPPEVKAAPIVQPPKKQPNQS
jgi:drug/metabolite transporter (DMT)-like permease